MKKFILTVLACLMLVTASANAEVLKDAEGFSYFPNYNCLVFTAGATVNSLVGVYDLSSIHILADNNQRFEFNVIELYIRYNDEKIMERRIKNIREDYVSGNIYKDGSPMKNFTQWGKTQREIYYKMKSAALSR